MGTKYKVVGEYWPKLYAPDYTAYITSIIKDKPDVSGLRSLGRRHSGFYQAGHALRLVF